MGALSNKCAVARGFFLGDLMKFNPRELVVTPKVVKSVEPKKLLQAFGRYRDGDWGDLPPEDIAANNEALKIGERRSGRGCLYYYRSRQKRNHYSFLFRILEVFMKLYRKRIIYRRKKNISLEAIVYIAMIVILLIIMRVCV